MTFIFDAPFGREPLTLSGQWPYMEPAMRERVRDALALGCYCTHDQPRQATLTRRNVGGAVSVYLQCCACGRSIGSAMARAQHPSWQDYPLWDQEMQGAYERARNEWRASQPTWQDRQLRRLMEYAQRSVEYEDWCRTSPEWHALAKLVAWRSRGHCEACLSAPAVTVHHVTYEFGKLPPAWHLKAVCQSCHTRLHCGSDEWCAEGMSR